MNPSEPHFNPEQTQALRATRRSWLLVLVLILPLPFLALLLTNTAWLEHEPTGSQSQAMFMAVGLGVALMFVGLFTRNQAYKRFWRGDVVEPEGFIRGNTHFLLALLMAGALIFAISLLHAYPAPSVAAAPVLLGLLVFNFPSGKPMLPAPPRIDDEGDSL